MCVAGPSKLLKVASQEGFYRDPHSFVSHQSSPTIKRTPTIIVSRKDNANYIVDGQQRLTSLTLLLIYLRNLQQDRQDRVNIDELIFSEKFGKKSFNMHIDE